MDDNQLVAMQFKWLIIGVCIAVFCVASCSATGIIVKYKAIKEYGQCK